MGVGWDGDGVNLKLAPNLCSMHHYQLPSLCGSRVREECGAVERLWGLESTGLGPLRTTYGSLSPRSSSLITHCDTELKRQCADGSWDRAGEARWLSLVPLLPSPPLSRLTLKLEKVNLRAVHLPGSLHDPLSNCICFSWILFERAPPPKLHN